MACEYAWLVRFCLIMPWASYTVMGISLELVDRDIDAVNIGVIRIKHVVTISNIMHVGKALSGLGLKCFVVRSGRSEK